MILFVASHRTKYKRNTSPFNEIFFKKIAVKHDLIVISIRNISLRRKIIHIEDFGKYKVVEISGFLLPTLYNKTILRYLNFFLSWIINFYLKRRELIKEIELVHQIGLFSPIGFYFSKFHKTKYILQIIGNDHYIFRQWRLKLKPDTIITGNAKYLIENINSKMTKHVIYRGVDIGLYSNCFLNSSFEYKRIFFGGGFPDYKERTDLKRFNYKGGISFLNVISSITGYEATIAGPKCEIGVNYVKTFNGNNNANKINFLGYLSHSQLLAKILQSDIVVIASFDEGIANIAMESMLAEKLVISRKVGGMGELILSGFNGILFESDEELREILINIQKEFYQNKCEKLNEMRKQARRWVIDKFNNVKMIEEYNNIYTQAVLAL